MTRSFSEDGERRKEKLKLLEKKIAKIMKEAINEERT